jgi:hypothetical protein
MRQYEPSTGYSGSVIDLWVQRLKGEIYTPGRRES